MTIACRNTIITLNYFIFNFGEQIPIFLKHFSCEDDRRGTGSNKVVERFLSHRSTFFL